jgi:hypothetical protein
MIFYNPKMQNNATFLKSSFNLNGTFVQMLHLTPTFIKKPYLIEYEISGTDGLVHEGEIKITESNSKKQIITFECKLDETYFCKVTGYFTESKKNMQTIRLFYKVENDSNEIVMNYERQKSCFRKVIDNDFDLPEDEGAEDEDPEDEEHEDNEDDEDDEDDEGMTLEMRVEQLKKFSNYFSEEE